MAKFCKNCRLEQWTDEAIEEWDWDAIPFPLGFCECPILDTVHFRYNLDPSKE